MGSTVFACDVSLKTVDSLGTVRRTSYERMIGRRSLVQCDRVPGIAEFEYEYSVRHSYEAQCRGRLAN